MRERRGMTEWRFGSWQAWAKNTVSESLKDWIHEQTDKYGKVKLVLRDNQHFIETVRSNQLQLKQHGCVMNHPG